MRPVALSDEIAVGEMPAVDQIAILAKAGFRSLLNVQPDGEVARLVSAADAGKAAEAAGLAYVHVPVTSRRPGDGSIAALAKAMESLPKRVYACCYSGARAAAGWALAVKGMAPAEIGAACTKAGYDMTAIMPDIERRHGAVPAVTPATAAASATTAAPVAAAAPATPQAATVPAVTPAAPAINGAIVPASAPAAVAATEKIIFPRAFGSGGFAVSG